MAGKINSNPVQQQINEETADLYAITYLEDYLDCVENMPDEIQRNVSRMNEFDIDYSGELLLLITVWILCLRNLFN